MGSGGIMTTLKRYKVRDDVDGYQIGDLHGVEVVLANDATREGGEED